MQAKVAPGRKTVPNLACLSCGLEIYLDEVTYANYRGPVRCSSCKGQQHVQIQRGELVTQQVGGDWYDSIADIAGWEIPNEQVADLAEAAHVLLQGAYKSSVVMSRRCVQGTLLVKGIGDKRLGLMLEEARGGVISEVLYQQATAVKKFGDAGAHPQDDELRVVTQIDASLCVQIVKEIYKHVFPLLRT